MRLRPDPWNWPIWGVYKVHTLGFGSGRTGAGSGRIPHVSGGAQCLQGRECSSSPTSGTCFPCSGACEPLTVYKSPLWAPAGPIFVVAAVLAAPCLGLDSGVGVYSFMAGSAWNCMTWDQILRVIPVGSRNSWQTVDVLDDVLERRAGLGEPIGFGDDRGAAGLHSRQGFVQSRPFLFLPVTPWSPLISSLGDAQTRKRLARRCQVLFVGADPGAAMICAGGCNCRDCPT